MFTRAPGVEDIFPDRTERWNRLMDTARHCFRLFNCREIIVPVMEYTELFVRGLGDETDIVAKEMFTFEDRGGRSLTLRPEGTASVVRAYVENGDYNRLSACKLFYAGPMFRAERPQKGRLRQFNQLGAEFFGSGDPWHDAESIALMDMISREAGVTDYRILVNSIGCPACRPAFIGDLKVYYDARRDGLCEDCRRRLERNPLRLLDCKQPGCRELKRDAPLITAHLCPDCRTHHTAVEAHLAASNIAFTADPHLVRGLDYYTRTTFEFVTERLGGQNAFAAGGRYDGLVEQFGGKPTPAVGFAAGIERMLILLEGLEIPAATIDAYLVHSGAAAGAAAMALCARLRGAGIAADLEPGSRGFKAQFKKADREGARFAVIIGDDELAANTVTMKNLTAGLQETVPLEGVVERLRASLNTPVGSS